MLHYMSNKDLLSKYDELVYGHTEAKKVLISLVNRSKMRHYQKYELHLSSKDLIEVSKCLLIGASGTGKTFLVEQLQQLVDFPLLILDATQLTPSGNSDGMNNKKVRDAISQTAEDWMTKRNKKGYTHSFEGTIDQMVVFVDEIDKLAHCFDSSGNWNKHVQSNFLTMFDHHGEGAGVSYIFAGAFVGLEHNNNNKSIGFTHTAGVSAPNTMVDERIVKYGIIPELVGRLTSIVELDNFTRDDYRRILTEELIPGKLHDLMYFNNSYIDLTDEQIDDIITKSVNSGQGVRFLKRELDKLCLDIEFNYEEFKNDRLLLKNFIRNDEESEWGTL